MQKFDIKDLDNTAIIHCNSWYDSKDHLYVYSFTNTPFGSVKVISSNDHTHHQHPLMVLLELSYDKNDIWWNNTSTVNKLFNDLCEAVLEDQEYFKSMFKLCTKYVINESLKELNNLIDYTEYWTGE